MKTLSILVFIFFSLTISAQADLDRGLIAYYPFDSSDGITGATLMSRVDLPGGLWEKYLRPVWRIPPDRGYTRILPVMEF